MAPSPRVRNDGWLRTAAAADVPALAALVNGAYRGDGSRAGWTTEADLLGGQRTDAAMLEDLIDRPDNRILVVEEQEGSLLACVHLERVGDGCYLGLLTVAPGRQRAGIGDALLEAAERFAVRTWQARYVEMTVIVQRNELIGWYQRRGYRDTGERRPFPYGDERFGVPRRDDLAFVLLRKCLAWEAT